MLAELGIPEGAGLLLVTPPDSALAEAGKLTPRPSIAPSILTAEPADVIAWWPDADDITETAVARLAWFLEMSGGSAWVILDPADGGPAAETVRAALAGAGLTVGDGLVLGRATALRLSLSALTEDQD